jgi:hypothetical protein
MLSIRWCLGRSWPRCAPSGVGAGGSTRTRGDVSVPRCAHGRRQSTSHCAKLVGEMLDLGIVAASSGASTTQTRWRSGGCRRAVVHGKEQDILGACSQAAALRQLTGDENQRDGRGSELDSRRRAHAGVRLARLSIFPITGVLAQRGQRLVGGPHRHVGPHSSGSQRVTGAGRVASADRAGWLVGPAHEVEIVFLFLESIFYSTQKSKEIWEKYLDTSENYETFLGGRLGYLTPLFYWTL